MAYEQARDPDALAALLLTALATPPQCRPVETDGAQRAAKRLVDLL